MAIRLLACALWAAFFGSGMFTLIAQGPSASPAPIEPPSLAPVTAQQSGWFLLASTLVATLGVIANTVSNSRTAAERHRADAEKQRADLAERQIKEMVAQFEELDGEKKALAMDRDTWMERAYRHGYRPGEDAPARKDVTP